MTLRAVADQRESVVLEVVLRGVSLHTFVDRGHAYQEFLTRPVFTFCLCVSRLYSAWSGMLTVDSLFRACEVDRLDTASLLLSLRSKRSSGIGNDGWSDRECGGESALLKALRRDLLLGNCAQCAHERSGGHLVLYADVFMQERSTRSDSKPGAKLFRAG